MSVAEHHDRPHDDASHHDHHARLAEAERKIEELTAALRDARQTHDEERELRETLNHSREALRKDLAAAQQRLDAESKAHAKTRGEHDLLQAKVQTLTGEVADARREANRQGERAEQVGRDLAASRRDLEAEQAGHRAAKEQVGGLEAAKSREAQELAQAQAQAQRAEAEVVALRERLAAEQSTLIEVQARCEALTQEVALAGERATTAKRALADETVAHGETRRRLEEMREAVRAAERKRQRQTIVSALGAAAIGLAAVLRRR